MEQEQHKLPKWNFNVYPKQFIVSDSLCMFMGMICQNVPEAVDYG